MSQSITSFLATAVILTAVVLLLWTLSGSRLRSEPELPATPTPAAIRDADDLRDAGEELRQQRFDDARLREHVQDAEQF